MATYNYDKPTRVLTVTLTAKEDKVLSRANQANGPGAIKNMFDTWLIAQINAYSTQDVSEIKTRLMTATDTEIAAVRSTLGLS